MEREELFRGFAPCGWAEFQALTPEARRAKFTMPGVDDPAILRAAHGAMWLEFSDAINAWRVKEHFLKDGGFRARDHSAAFDTARHFYSALMFNAIRPAYDDASTEAFPANELINLTKQRERTNWRERWASVGGTFYGKRMVAPVADPVWVKLSVTGLPYPPFEFGSDMDWRSVSAREWTRLNKRKSDES
jgi:hypothetical protein